jgi:hypothetical protein
MTKKGEHLSEEAKRKLSEAHKGMHASEETRKKMSDAGRKLDDNQAALLMHHFVNSYTPTKELEERYGVSNQTITQSYRLWAIEKGLLTQEEYEDAKRRRELGRNRKMSEEAKKSLSEKLKGENAPAYGTHPSEETLEKMRRAALIREKRKLKRYQVEYEGSKFGTSSISEGASAIMLQRYIPGFKIEHDKTFQENGDTGCIYDFILKDAILEWHPIEIAHDGDKYLPEDYKVFKELKASAKTGDRKAISEIKRSLEKDLAVEYWFTRQDASNGSQIYKGKEVFLARDTQELYDFISRYNKNMISYGQFKDEFGGLCGYVKQFERKKKESAKLEQKVEAA